VHAGGVEPRCTRPHGDAARRVDELVVRLVVGPAGLEVAGGDAARCDVDGDDLRAHPQVDVVGPVLLRRAGDELRLLRHRAADPVRDAAGRVRGRATPLEGDDLQVVGGPPLARLAGRAHARGVPADHHQPFA
jgi:hypothetical protein